MASGGSNDVQNPPVLDDNTNYENWIKDLEVWKLFTTTVNTKKGARLYLCLKGKARELVRSLSIETIGAENGLDSIVEKLDEHYKKDKVQRSYMELEAFERFRRKSDMKINEYITEFEKLNNKIKEHDMNLPDGVVAYKLLHHANLGENEVNLIKATMSQLSYKEIKEKMQKIFSDITSKPTIKTEPEIKVEETYYISNRGRGRWRGRMYRGDNFRGRNYGSNQFRSRGQYSGNKTSTRKMNPPDENGQVSKCIICQSIFHWAKFCPDAYENQNVMNKPLHLVQEDDKINQNLATKSRYPMFLKCESKVDEITLFKTDELDNEKELQIFMGEALSSAVIDSGAPETVSGRNWVRDYMNTLTEDEKKLVVRRKIDKTYKFGNSKPISAEESVELPMTIASKEVMLTTDIVDVDVPLLLSKKALKKAQAIIDFNEDTIELFGRKENLLETSSGHYMIPVQNNINARIKPTISYNLICKEDDVMKKAVKVHRHFSHAPKKRLRKLLEDADMWSEEMSQALTEIEKTCKECKIYSKPPSRPVVGMSFSKSFNDVLTMDLKDYKNGENKHKLLHIVDMCTRFSQCARVKSKKKEEILEVLFKAWIQVFGPPNKILTDNGGEFLNHDFLELCDKLNINMKMTAAESPWSNGIVERHNAVLNNTLNKTLEEIEDFDMALAWAVQAKNSMYNYHGFSPFTLVFGMNPKIPTTLDCNLPVLESVTTSEILAKNLNAMNTARQAYVKSESAEKVKRALRHNVSGAAGKRFYTSDKVYIKRRKDDRWSGPGVVIGQDYQQILVRIGGFLYRVHPCRIILAQESEKAINKSYEENMKTQEENLNNHAVELDIEDEVEIDGMVEQVEEGQHDEEVQENIEEQQAHENRDNEILNNEVGDNNEVRATDRRQRFPRIGINIKYRTHDEDEWKEAEVESRVHLYKDNNLFNVKLYNTEEAIQVDFKNEVKEWKLLPNQEETEEIYICAIKEREEIKLAKSAELENWRRNQVYEEVEDAGQDRVSVKWILKEKISDGKIKYKARLVARGFEELGETRSDSPTCSKESIRIMLTIAAAKSWNCNALDIKAAFLQGNPIGREVYLKPPVEAKCQGKLWQLRRCVYGLQDASRNWYIKVKEEMIKLGARVVTGDPAFFYWKKENELYGVLSSHVDDFLHSGTREFEERIIYNLKNKFEISNEVTLAFAYLGINLETTVEGFTLDQIQYVQDLNLVEINENRKLSKNEEVNEKERSEMRTAIGKLNWLKSQTRPDIAFEVSVAASQVHKAKVKDIIELNKLIKKTKSEEVMIKFPRLKNLKECRIVVFADASFGNLEQSGSQGAHIIFLADKDQNATLLSWNSKKLKRIVRSTLAAETLALSDAVDTAHMINRVLSQLLLHEEEMLMVECLVDSHSLVESIRTTHTLTERRLLIDMSALREARDKEEIDIHWIETKRNLANPLTKKSAYSGALIEVLKSGRLI